MIILLGVLDFSHVKTTNPADFVVSNRKNKKLILIKYTENDINKKLSIISVIVQIAMD